MTVGEKQMYNLYVVKIRGGEQIKVISTSTDGAIKKINRFTGKRYGRRDISRITVVDEGIL